MATRDSAPRQPWLGCTALALLLVGPADGVYGQVALPRIRSGSAEVTALLDFGSARSATFLSILDRLKGSTVIVYIRFARCTGGVPGCLHYLGERGTDRYVRITIDRLAGSATRLCCLLAHELQHAVELADAPEARTHAEVGRRLSEIGRQWGEGFETDAAVAVTRAVERELWAASGGEIGARP